VKKEKEDGKIQEAKFRIKSELILALTMKRCLKFQGNP